MDFEIIHPSSKKCVCAKTVKLKTILDQILVFLNIEPNL